MRLVASTTLFPLEKGGLRGGLHVLPKYAPETNPIKRVWWHLHEDITRNHRCETVDELLILIFNWLEDRRPFKVEDNAYQRRAA